MLEAQYDATVAQPAFDSLRELAAHLNREKNRLRNFQKAVGSTRSISDCIEQLKAAVKYPPHGLPVLLAGQPGTGKKLLARLMYEYAADEGVLPPGRLVTAGCGRIPQRRGGARPDFRRRAPGGRPRLPCRPRTAGCCCSTRREPSEASARRGFYSSCRPALFPLRGGRRAYGGRPPRLHRFRRAGARARPALQRLIPVSVSVPPLEERTPEEKKELLLYFFKREARKNGARSLSARAFSTG